MTRKELGQTETMGKDGREVADYVIERAGACAKAYAALIDPIRRVARQFGYAIAVHGSLARDIDMIACPWSDDAVDAQLLVDAIAEMVKGHEGGHFGYVDPDCPREKPHGRRAWSIHGWAFYIDLSVMPRLAA